MLKITAVRTTPLRAALDAPFWSSGFVGMDPKFGMHVMRSVLLVEVETADGLVGLGQCVSSGKNLSALAAFIQDELATYLIGEDAFARERLWETMYRVVFPYGRKGLAITAMSGLDIALWDVVGKALDTPIYRLLGAAHEALPAYASVGFYAEGKGLRELEAEIKRVVGLGFRAVKMKIGSLPLEEDLERVATVQRALPPGAGLMADANRAYDPKTALRMAERLEEYDVLFFEEPTNPDDLEGAAMVGTGSPVPIAGYETEYTRYGFRELITRRAIDVAQPNVTWCGGITEGRKIGVLASSFHLTVVPHTFGSPLTLISNLHLAASLPNATAVEFDMTGNPLMRELLEEVPRIDAESRVALPQGPGLGVRLNREAVERWRIR
ncbi:MAG: mandelate racemase/muconate lactonizing enzyme family protein [Chloroflexi bacterium]|nr:mandelate racemase/muconate lactonizing enzyme family protein [Chloroflexota bacterium]